MPLRGECALIRNGERDFILVRTHHPFAPGDNTVLQQQLMHFVRL